MDPANGELLCLGRCSGNRQIFDCFTVTVIIRSHNMSCECRLTCKPAFDERDCGAFLIVGALPPFPPLPPLPPFPDCCKQQATYTTHKVRLVSGLWCSIIDFSPQQSWIIPPARRQQTSFTANWWASLPYVSDMPCWGQGLPGQSSPWYDVTSVVAAESKRGEV